MLREALEAARAFGDERARSEALAALAPRLAELGHPAEALEAARAIESEWSRSRALAALAPHLTEPLLREALEAARVIGNWGARSEALAALAPHLGPTERDRALREALEAARAIGDGRSRSRRWPRWPPTWGRPSGTEPSARRWRRRGPSGTGGPGPEALAALAPHLTEPLLREALEAARAFGDEWFWPRGWPRWPLI